MLGLARDGRSTVLAADVVCAADTVRIEPHARHRRDLTGVDSEPLLVERCGDLGDVAGQVVGDRTTSLGSETVDDPSAGSGVTGDHDVAFGVDQHQMHAIFIGDRSAHIGNWYEHVPDRPVDLFDVPCSCDRVERAGGLVIEHSGVVDVAAHGLHVVPDTERVQGIGLTGRVADGGCRLETQQIQRQRGVGLAEQRSAPQVVGSYWHVVGFEDPPRELAQREVLRDRRDRLRKRPQQLGAHAGIGGACGGEHEPQFPDDRLRCDVHTEAGGRAVDDVLLRPGDPLGELRRVGGNDHDPGWTSIGFASAGESVEQVDGVGAGVHVQARWGDAARSEMVGRFGQEHRASSDAVHGGGLDHHGSRARTGGEPCTEFRIRCDQRDITEGHPVMQHARRCCDVEQPRRSVSMAEQMRDRCGLGPRPQAKVADEFGFAVARRRLAHEPVHGVAVTFGVDEALHHQHHCGITGHLAVVAERPCGRLHVDGVAAEVDRTDQCRVDLAGAQCPHRETQRVEAAVLLRAHGEAGPTEVVLTVEPVGDEVGHRAEHAGRRERRPDAIAYRFERLSGAGELGAPVGETPACPEAGRFGVGAHTDVHRRGVDGQGACCSEGLVGDLQYRQLLAQRCFQILRRKPLRDESQFDARESPGAVDVEAGVVGDDRVPERREPDSACGGDTDAHDRNRFTGACNIRSGPTCLGCEQTGCRRWFFDDEVGVVAAEAERGHAGAQHPVRSVGARPRLSGVEHTERRVDERVVRVVHVERRRANLVAHCFGDLDQPGDTRRRDEVAGVRLQRTDREASAICVHVSARSDLGCIADAGAGGVALEQRDVRRVETGEVERRLHGPNLAVGRRCEQTSSTTVVRQSDATDDPVDRVTVAHRVGETAQRDEPAPFGRDETVGVDVERPRPPRGAQRLECRETGMDEQVVGAVHGAGEHQIGVAVVESIAGQLDRIQAARAGGIQRQCADAETQRPLEQECRKSGHEPIPGIAGVGRRVGGAARLTRLHCLRERGHARRRERQIAENCSEASGIAVVVAGVAHCLTGGVERPEEEGVEPDEFVGGHGETGRVEQVLEPGHVPSTVRPGAVGAVVTGCAQDVGRSDVPPVGRHAGDQVVPGHHTSPELVRRVGSRQEAGPPDNRDRCEDAHGSARVIRSPVVPSRRRGGRPERARLHRAAPRPGRSGDSTTRRPASVRRHRVR